VIETTAMNQLQNQFFGTTMPDNWGEILRMLCNYFLRNIRAENGQ